MYFRESRGILVARRVGGCGWGKCCWRVSFPEAGDGWVLRLWRPRRGNPLQKCPRGKLSYYYCTTGCIYKIKVEQVFFYKNNIFSSFFLDWDLMGNVTRPPRTPDKGDGVACDNKGSGNSLGLASLIDCTVSRAKTVAIKWVRKDKDDTSVLLWLYIGALVDFITPLPLRVSYLHVHVYLWPVLVLDLFIRFIHIKLITT